MLIGALVIGWLSSTAWAAPPRGQTPDLAFEEVVLGENHGCGRTKDGQVACWGRNDRGQLGDGTYNDSAFPRGVEGIGDAVGLTAGAAHTCALRRDRSIACWGDNQAGQIGAGDQETQPFPVPVEAIGGVLSVAAGTSHTCAVGLDGRVSCWGDNLYRQLGVDDLRRAPRPVPVVVVPPAVDVAAGYAHSCAATREGQVWCWGDATHHATGRPPPGGGKPLGAMPVDAPLPSIRAVEARGHLSCALHAEGVHCWGATPVEQAEGGGRPPELWVKQSGLVQLSVGWGHGCALNPRGDVTCFGDNRFGQLGHIAAPRPVVVGAYGVRDATWVGAGNGETCAARGPSERTVCWGSYTDDEKARAKLETQELPPEEEPARYKAPRGTELDIAIVEAAKKTGNHLQIEVRTLDMQTCANSQLDVQTELKKHSLKLTVGDPYLPGGDCIAKPGPAVTRVDLPADFKGRLDLTVRYEKQEDLYQVFIRDDKVEAIPMLSTFSRWPEPRRVHRIPEGSLAVTCIDHLEQAVCQRRLRDGLPTCKDVLETPMVRDAPPLKKEAWANDFFTADPRATYISPDFEHDRYRELFEKTFRDGSACLDLRVRTWNGEIWSNRVDETGAP